MAGEYAVARRALESEMGIDFRRQYGVSRVGNGRIVTEFTDRPEPVLAARHCDIQDIHGNCLAWGEELQM
ncbi:hypothetical protein [Streptomyces sp. NRRL B-24484]|uniref:hypothetical protein n=1 Tax=Streptomyces sp. NRRL B-24484 TaxID=1463833 RepID=UPI0004C061BC|nr:hypothetical protein [Streptomyces sp. NRRL B-24484]